MSRGLASASSRLGVLTEVVRPGKETILAFLTSSTAELLTRLLTLALTLLTARILEPRDVGTLGLAVMVSAIVSMVGYYAEGAAVVARGAATDEALSGAAALWRAAVTLVLIAIVLASLPRIGGLVATGAVSYFEQLARPMLLVPALESVATYPRVLLQRRLRLRRVVTLQFVQAVCYVGGGAGLLLIGCGVWSLIWAQVISAVLITLQLWIGLSRSVGIRGVFVPEAIRTVGRGYAKLFTGGICGFLSERVDNFLVGGALGPASMSFYSMAWTASRTPVFVLARTLNAVMLPMLPRALENRAWAEGRVRMAARSSIVLMTLAGATLFSISHPATELILGAKWLPLVPGLRLMSLTISLTPLWLIAATLLLASGKAHLAAIASVAHVGTLLALVPPLCARFGVLGGAIADLAATATTTTILILTVRLGLGRYDWTQLTDALRTIVSGVCAAAATEFLLADHGLGVLNMVARATMVMVAFVGVSWPLGGAPVLRETASTLRAALRDDIPGER